MASCGLRMKSMIPLKSEIGFAIGLFLFCCAYWMLDSAWSFLSFERNLSALVFQEPMSYFDTVLLKVSPYQIVSRIMVTGIFMGSGTVIALFFYKQKKIEEKNIRLERQLQQAHKMESIGTLAGGISHDFNNILYGAIGYTDLCLDDAEPDSLIHNNLEEIKSGLLRAKSLTKQILAFSRKDDTEIEPTVVAPVVNEVVQLLKATIPSTIAINVDTDVTESTIMGDPTKIHQVVMNLCTNAIHAMEENGGILEITLDQLDIGSNPDGHTHSSLSPGPYLRLRVTDTGTGIPPNELNRVFDPYFTSKEQGKGTGMGLAVVHGIVQSYHGRILVESREDFGTRFDTFFPLLEENGISPEKRNHLILPHGNEHILLVDDHPQVLNIQTRFLKRLGYKVSAKSTSLEAVQAIKKGGTIYDAVIADMTLPQIPGDLLADRIKKMAPDLRVILCTGYSEKISNTQARDLGIDAILMKPVANATLAKMLRQVIDR